MEQIQKLNNILVQLQTVKNTTVDSYDSGYVTIVNFSIDGDIFNKAVNENLFGIMQSMKRILLERLNECEHLARNEMEEMFTIAKGYAPIPSNY